MFRALQVTDTFRRWDDAYGSLCAQRCMDLFLGGRVYKRDGIWHMQALHEAEGAQPGDWMPDGVRVVLVPNGIATLLGIARGGTCQD